MDQKEATRQQQGQKGYSYQGQQTRQGWKGSSSQRTTDNGQFNAHWNNINRVGTLGRWDIRTSEVRSFYGMVPLVVKKLQEKLP